MLILDTGGVSRLAARSVAVSALIRSLVEQDLWPPLVPTMVMVESLHGDSGPDANTHRFLKTCIIEPSVTEPIARRAAELRHRASRGSAVAALVVAMAEPNGTVLTGDAADIGALAANAKGVDVHLI